MNSILLSEVNAIESEIIADMQKNKIRLVSPCVLFARSPFLGKLAKLNNVNIFFKINE